MFLGIEIGGTKLQLGVGDGSGGELVEQVRRDVDRTRGAEGILKQIEETAAPLIAQHAIERIAIGFGGPVDGRQGIVRCSHQVAGWEDFPLAAWCEQRFAPTRVRNDCDCAALAEARFGAGRGSDRVLYVTVGTGVGGGLVSGGRLEGRARPAVSEIGHLRPGLECRLREQTVESIASGPGLVATLVGLAPSAPQAAAELRDAHGPLDGLTAREIAEAAQRGNALACRAIARGVQTLGWALAQAITIWAPEVVVVGGGVSLMGDGLFFEPLRARVAEYVFAPLCDAYRITPPDLEEAVVVCGAVAVAADPADPR